MVLKNHEEQEHKNQQEQYQLGDNMGTSIGDPSGAKKGLDYYKKQNKQENYYIKKGAIGYLHGQGIVDIGLKVGEALELKTFKKLLQGYHPVTGKKLTKYAGKDRDRAYFDVTNSPPKSFSIMVAQLESRGDFKRASALRDLHEEANQTAMKILQNNFTRTRISTGRKDPKTGKTIMQEVQTNGLMYATIQHDTAREVEGKVDPQIHSHNVIFNQVTRIDKNGNVKTTALHNNQIYANRVSIELVYNTQLAKLLKENGIEVELTNTKRAEWEIVGFEREQIMEFSSRRVLIERELPKYKERYPTKSEGELKELIVLESREAKSAVDMKKLLLINRERMEKAGISDKHIDEILKDFGTKDLTVMEEKIKQELIRAYIEKALFNVTEKYSVFNEEKVFIQAMQQSGLHGFNFNREDFEQSFYKMSLEDVDVTNPLQLVEIGEDNLFKQYSTREIIEAEQEILKACNQNLKENKKIPFFSNKAEIETLISQKEKAIDSTYTKGQRAMIEAVLGSDNRFVNIQGDAGSGKTFSVAGFVDILKQKFPDIEILGLSYQGKAVSILGEDAGIKVQTLHSYLGSEEKKKENKGKPQENKPKLIIVDENTMSGSIQIKNLIKSSEERGDMILFMGDKKQIQSMNAGNVHTDMQIYGMETSFLDENLRQKTQFGQDMVQAIKDKDFDKAFSLLENGEKITEVNSNGEEVEYMDKKIFEGSTKEMTDKLISDYQDDYKKYGEATQLYSALNVNRRVINLSVREIEKARGTLNKEDSILATLEQVTLQNIEREVAVNYKEGTLITINKAIAGFKAGSKAIVLGAKAGTHNIILVEREGDRKVIEINLSKIVHKNIGIYKQKNKDFSIGERIKYTKNDAKGLGVKNGDEDKIIKIEGDIITTKKGKEIDVKAYPYLDYGYCISVHNSQGMTANRGRVLGDSDMVTLNNFYVQGTRNKKDVHFYVKSVEDFKRNSMIAEENTTTLKFLTAENVQEFLNKTNQKGVENGSNITKENGRNPQRANGQDARDQENGHRGSKPVNNTQEREHSVDLRSGGNISDIVGREGRGQSTSRIVGEITRGNGKIVGKIGQLLSRIDNLIQGLNKKIAELSQMKSKKKENITTIKRAKFERITNEEIREIILEKVEKVVKQKVEVEPVPVKDVADEARARNVKEKEKNAKEKNAKEKNGKSQGVDR